MADADGRGDYYRGGGPSGGGGYEGGGGRKRRYREDDDSRRPHNDDRRRGGHESRPQRKYAEETNSARVRKQILAIAESPLRNAQEDVQAIAKNILDSKDDYYFVQHLSDISVQLVTEQPFKIPFVAAIVLYSNQDNGDFARLVLKKAGEKMQAALDIGDWRSFKLVIRFLACLQTLFEAEGVFAILEELFNKAADLQSASSEDIIGIELVKVIMLTIPYALTSAPAFQQQAAELLNKTDIIASALPQTDTLADPYISVAGEVAPQSQNTVALLQRQLEAEAERGWPLLFMPRLFRLVEDLIEVEGASATQKHEFPAVNVPQTIAPGARPLFPQVYFSLYADQDVETVPPTSSVAASLFRDTLVDTINILNFNRTAAAKYLIDMDCFWAPGTFVKRATPFDKIKDTVEGSTWKPEDLAVDAIFSAMLQLPSPEHKLVFYHSMITETCKLAPASIAPSLGRAIRNLYRNLLLMDVELSYRFLDWFAHHLSNFDFRWKWVEWVDDVELGPVHPRKAFILGALDKEVRLSFAKRVRDTLPEQYHVLIPASKDNDIPDFKYNNELTPYSTEGKQMISHLKKKAPETEIQPIIDAITTAEITNASSNPGRAAIDVYVTSLCYIGSKSLSHVLSFIERRKDGLIGFGPVPGGRAQIISSVVAYWRDVQPGVAVNIVDKLLNYTILTPTSVVEWALSTERLDRGRVLAETWVYEMVERTLGKVTGRVSQIVAARMQTGLPSGQIQVLEKALAEEVDGMRVMFNIVDDALAGVAEGGEENMIENGVKDAEESNLLKAWGQKWRKVFARKLAVAEMEVREAERVFPGAGEEMVGIDAMEGQVKRVKGHENGDGEVKDEKGEGDGEDMVT